MHTVYHNGVKQFGEFRCVRNARTEAWTLCRRGGGTSEVRLGETRITGFRATTLGKGGWAVEEC